MRERLANPAGLVERTLDIGDIVAFRAGPVPVVLLHNPSDVETFLQTRARVFTRGLGFEVLKPVLGDGLFTCPENVWKPQRRLAQVSLQTRHVEAAAPLLTSIARTWIARHTAGAPGGRARVDMKTEGSLLALEGYFRAQMGLHRPEDYPRLVEATDALKRNAHERLHALFLRSTGWPTRSNRTLRRWRRYLIGLADTLAAQRPEIAGNCGFLATHVDALAAGHDALPSRERLREQIITFLVTGHETVAATLALGLQSLAFHPRVQDALREECDAAFSAHGAEGCQTADVVSNLPYLDAVVREMLRHFPAAWLMSKQAVEEVTLGGHVFPPGTVFAAVPYSVHRDPRFWSEPDVFLPERFLRGEPTRRFAWFPFGAGPRACIGGAFATLELKVLLFHLVRELTIAPVEAKPIPPEFSVTLKPMSGLPLAIATRNPTP
jgi:cytochrome P450